MAGKNGRADVRESGILNDAAHKTLRATIDLVHGGSGSKGNEIESVLVNGDDVINKTMPVILCDEDDVQGNHGATIGSVDPQQMDYLMGRGLSREQAQGLFVRALFDDALIEAAHPRRGHPRPRGRARPPRHPRHRASRGRRSNSTNHQGGCTQCLASSSSRTSRRAPTRQTSRSSPRTRTSRSLTARLRRSAQRPCSTPCASSTPP